jgi:hypothetical protein
MYYEGSTVLFLLHVIVMNGYMGITRDLAFHIIECNCDECITKNLTLYYIE